MDPNQNSKPTWTASIQQINLILSTSREIVVMTRPSPDLDLISAAVSLASSLKKIGRRCSIVCPTPLAEETSQIKGIDQVLSSLPKKQLTVVINYSDGSFSQGRIQKNDKALALELLPSDDQKPIVPINIESDNYDSKPDCVILLGVSKLADLEEFIKGTDLMSKVPVVNVDNGAENANFGRVNLVDKKATSISEMVTLMMYDLRVGLDPDTAENLYQGMASKTQNFTEKNFSANLLEAASICLRYQKRSTTS